MSVDAICEDLYVGKVVENLSPDACSAKPGDYALFHVIDGISTPRVGISYDFLTGYLSGLLYAKPKGGVTLTNGVTELGRGGWFPKVDISHLEQKDIEKILEGSGLNNKYSVEDFR